MDKENRPGFKSYTDRLSLPNNGMAANDTIVLELQQEDQDGGHKLEVHKVILAATSTVFCNMFEADAGCKTIKVTGSQPAWELILTRIYPSSHTSATKPKPSQILTMLPVVHKYNFRFLLTDCLAWASQLSFSATLCPIPWIAMANDLQLEELARTPMKHIIASGLRVATSKARQEEYSRFQNSKNSCYECGYGSRPRAPEAPAPAMTGDVQLLQNVRQLSLQGLPVAVHAALAELTNALNM